MQRDELNIFVFKVLMHGLCGCEQIMLARGIA